MFGSFKIGPSVFVHSWHSNQFDSLPSFLPFTFIPNQTLFVSSSSPHQFPHWRPNNISLLHVHLPSSSIFISHHIWPDLSKCQLPSLFHILCKASQFILPYITLPFPPTSITHQDEQSLSIYQPNLSFFILSFCLLHLPPSLLLWLHLHLTVQRWMNAMMRGVSISWTSLRGVSLSSLCPSHWL